MQYFLSKVLEEFKFIRQLDDKKLQKTISDTETLLMRVADLHNVKHKDKVILSNKLLEELLESTKMLMNKFKRDTAAYHNRVYVKLAIRKESCGPVACVTLTSRKNNINVLEKELQIQKPRDLPSLGLFLKDALQQCQTIHKEYNDLVPT